jgi:tektin-3
VQGLQYYAGIERYDPTVCDAPRWAAASAATLQRSQSERAKAVQMLSGTHHTSPCLFRLSLCR